MSSCAKQNEDTTQETEEHTFAELTEPPESNEEDSNSKSKDNFTVTYKIYKDGKLKTEKKKSAKLGSSVSFEPPEAPLGYTYDTWSDGSAELKRTDTEEDNGKIYSINCIPEYAGVPTIEIFTSDGKGIASKTRYSECTVTLSNFDESGCFENVPAQVRGRGNTSWD